MCAARLPGFILPGGFGGALLVVSILGVVCDCYLWLLLRSWGGSWWFLWGLWVLFGLGWSFPGSVCVCVCGLVGCVQS